MPIVKQYQDYLSRVAPITTRSWVDDLTDWLGITSRMQDRPQWNLQHFVNMPRDPTYGRADLIRRLSERYAEGQAKRRMRGPRTSDAFDLEAPSYHEGERERILGR